MLLCLSASCADCFRTGRAPAFAISPLPQRVLRGLLLTAVARIKDYLNFASARPARIASQGFPRIIHHVGLCLSASCADCFPIAPRLVPSLPLCLSASCADCFAYAMVQADVWETLPQRVLRGLLPSPSRCGCSTSRFASARPARIASAKTHKVKPAFMMDDAVSR